MVGVMWLLPVLLAITVGIKIYQICHSHSQRITKDLG